MRHLSVGGPSLSSAGLIHIGKHYLMFLLIVYPFIFSSSTCSLKRNRVEHCLILTCVNYPSLFRVLAKGCLRLQELELDRTIAINEEIAHAMCLCGLRGLETISFTFTPVSPGAIKELLGNIKQMNS